MTIEGDVYDQYNPILTPKLHAEAVRVLRSFSFAGAHVIIIGGLAPSLLVPHLEPGLSAHIGTQDLDLCLSVALVEGKVGSYDRLERSLRRAGFSMSREEGQSISWRWRGGIDVPLTVEFFCSVGPGRSPGRLFRPGGVVGGKLSALVLATGALIDKDTRDVWVDVTLPDGGGETRHSVKVIGPAAYLASKAVALTGRDKNKDAYDVIWLIESWPGGPSGLAQELSQSPITQELQYLEALETLQREFASIESAGAVKYGRFMTDYAQDRVHHMRRSVGAVKALLNAL